MKLAESVPRHEAEPEKVRSKLKEENGQLKEKLAASVPKAEAEREIQELQRKLSNSKSKADVLHENVTRLESRLVAA